MPTRGFVSTVVWLALPFLVFVGFGVVSLAGPAILPPELTRRLPDAATWLHKAVGCALWMTGAWLVSRMLEIFLWQGVVRPLIGRAVPGLLRQSLMIVVYVAALTGIDAVVFGQSVTGIWATSGAIGIVLGLALQRTIGDIFAGLAVNIDQAYQIGDWIELMDKNYPHIYGQIREIHWRATRIHTVDGREIIVPNSVLGGMVIANYSLPDDICRFELPITLDVRVPTDEALRVMRAGALASCRGGRVVEDPAPTVIIGGPVAGGMEYIVRYCIRVGETVPATGRHEVARAVLRHLQIAGIQTVDTAKLDVIHMPAVTEAEMTVDPRLRLIEGIELLGETLTPEEIQDLAGKAHERRFDQGDVVVRQGEPGRSLFVISEGIVEVSLLRDGTAQRLALVEAGEFIGEMSLLTGEPRTATVIALTDIVAYEITDADLAPLLASRPDLFEALSVLAAERRLGHHPRLGPGAAQDDESRGLSQQILTRMSSFFRQLGQRRNVVG